MPLNNVPLAGQDLLTTRDAISGNFSVINTAFTVDHVSYNLTGQGKHNKITLPVQGVAPTFAAGEEGIYNLPFNNGTNTKNETFIHKQTLAGTADIPFTASSLSSTAPANNQPGWLYLPSGHQLRWDTVNAPSTGNNIITIRASFPAFTNFLWVGGIVPTSARTIILLGINSSTTFTVNMSGPGSFVYFAIGV